MPSAEPKQSVPSREPLILEVKGNALEDGPGVRSVIFFKGCPLTCPWCHNPEGIRPGVELSFDAGVCVACDSCIEVCQQAALDRQRPGFLDRQRCDGCLDCAEVCPSGALSRVGQPRPVQDLLAQALRYRAFYDASGGGVTLSGGEPTLHLDYLGRLVRALGEAGIRTLLETCGLFAWDRFESLVLPHLDAVYFDLKLMDDGAHRHHCGASNRVILDNFARLSRAAASHPLELLPRTPLVPGITATEDNIRALAAFLLENDVRRARLLSYNPLWPDKASKLGHAAELARQPQMTSFQPREEQARLEAILTEAGIDTGQEGD
jgi:pyruvate formate lyase activating enzyme